MRQELRGRKENRPQPTEGRGQRAGWKREKADFRRTRSPSLKLTYIIFVYRFWEACHLNEGADLGETSQTRTIEAMFLEGLNQSVRSRTGFSSFCGSVGSLRWCERSFLWRFRLLLLIIVGFSPAVFDPTGGSFNPT